ncbi:hypothetical protein [Undibacterium terreum]|uniref:hypothetical protein n=1 Tax=Undibacterium terreum TaxID=1224302 RepID=UPI001669E1DD|nr:hypothetical protein [Undibacterium terreum]
MLTILAALIPTLAHANDADCDKLIRDGQYLHAMDCIGTGKGIITAHNRSIILSFLGREREAQQFFSKEDNDSFVIGRNPGLSAEKINDTHTYQQRAAIPALTALAAPYQVVMLNEAHHISQHRIFALQLAKALRERGFTHLAVETLANAEETQKQGYPSLKSPTSGNYTADPEFAFFLREAISLGYQLVSYESYGNQGIADREKGQASNLKKLMDREPNAKVLVYAGYAHIRKFHTGPGPKWMAEVFKELTGIDPLTIDQEGGTPNPYDKLTDKTWMAVKDQLQGEPSVFVKNGSEWLVSKSYQSLADISVFHPETKLVDGRPDWLAKNRTKHIVKTGKIGTGEQIVIRAMVKGEQNGIPVDQVLVDGNAEEAILFLPKGSYQIEKETLPDGIVKLYELSIGQ